jgi:hypothetical protein
MSPRIRPVKSAGTPAAPATQQAMTKDQGVRLKALAGEALEPEAFHPGLSAAEAERRIKALEAKLATMDGPPHTT